MQKTISLIFVLLVFSGCASIHFKNAKCISADASNITTSIGNIEKGKAGYCSQLEIWIPWKLKEEG